MRGRGDSSSRTRMFGENLAREFQRCNGLLASHRWELLQKYFETVASFEILEKDPCGHARSHEHGGTAQDFRVAMHDQFFAERGNMRSVRIARPGSPINRLETAQCTRAVNLEIAVRSQDLQHSGLLCHPNKRRVREIHRSVEVFSDEFADPRQPATHVEYPPRRRLHQLQQRRSQTRGQEMHGLGQHCRRGQQFPRSRLAKEVNGTRMIGVALAGERNQRAGINQNAPHCAAIWLSGSEHDALPRRSGRP